MNEHTIEELKDILDDFEQANSEFTEHCEAKAKRWDKYQKYAYAYQAVCTKFSIFINDQERALREAQRQARQEAANA